MNKIAILSFVVVIAIGGAGIFLFSTLSGDTEKEDTTPENTVLSGLEESRMHARDAKRQSDLRQMNTAMELAYEENIDKYPQYTSAEWQANGKIGTAMPKIPVDPSLLTPYSWIDNTDEALTGCDSQRYCAYAELEKGAWFAISQKGVIELDYDPSLSTSPNKGQCPCF